MKEHNYKGFNIVRNGTKDCPWNIYKDDGYGHGKRVSCDKTIKQCKDSIDNGDFRIDE